MSFTILAQNDNYDYDNWPGKSGVIKGNIYFPTQLISQFDLTLAKGSNGSSFFYKVKLYDTDDIKNGRLKIDVYSSINDAQLSLIEYLDCLQTPFKPSRLTTDDLEVGDVTFSQDSNDILLMAFTRNNIRVIVHAPTGIANILAFEIDKTIINAPVWTEETLKPSFELPN